MIPMVKGTGFNIPEAAANALNLTPGQMQVVTPAQQPVAHPTPAVPATTTNAPPIATQCFMLSNMFDPTE